MSCVHALRNQFWLTWRRAGKRRSQQTLEVQRGRLINERSKLLQAHYAGAVPLDLLKSEQDRIGGQLALVDGRLLVSCAVKAFNKWYSEVWHERGDQKRCWN